VTDWQWVDDAAGPVVRPYAMVRGRTAARRELYDLVAFMVTVVDSLRAWVPMEPEHLSILTMCRQPRSVTEVAAGLQLPLGVVRVLIGDLVEMEAIRIREPSNAGGRPSPDIIRQVLDALHAL